MLPHCAPGGKSGGSSGGGIRPRPRRPPGGGVRKPAGTVAPADACAFGAPLRTPPPVSAPAALRGQSPRCGSPGRCGRSHADALRAPANGTAKRWRRGGGFAPLPLSPPQRSAGNRDGVPLKNPPFLPSDWLRSVSFGWGQYQTPSRCSIGVVSALCLPTTTHKA